MSEEMLTTAELAEIKARLGMRQWVRTGGFTWDNATPPPLANWLTYVTVDDVARLIAEIERLQAVVAAKQRECDEGLVLVARLRGCISYGQAAEWLGMAATTVPHMERVAADLGHAVVLAGQNKKKEEDTQL